MAKNAAGHAVSVAFMQKRGEMMARQDREWVAALPDGWFASREAADLWCLSLQPAQRRLDLLRCSGAVRQRGFGRGSRWLRIRRQG